MMSTFQGIFGSVVKSIESDPIGQTMMLGCGKLSFQRIEVPKIICMGELE